MVKTRVAGKKGKTNLLKGIDYELDHIGIAVESIEKSLALYRTLGWSDFDLEEVPTEKVRVAFIRLKNTANIELLEPTSKEGPIAKFLERKGQGIHHICLRVRDLENVLEELKKQGVRLIDEKPRQGAHRCKVAFVHPSSCSGVLIELSQPER